MLKSKHQRTQKWLGNLPYNIVTSQYLKRAPLYLDDDEVAQMLYDWFVDNVIKTK